MKNPATHRPTRDEFNAFTQWIHDACVSGQWKPLVRLRNGQIREIEWFVGTGYDEGCNYLCHKSEGSYMIWNNDGTSITSRDFDMMELV